MTVQTISKHRVWAVTSETTLGALYRVVNHNGEWTCDCPDCFYRGHECKHIREVKAQQPVVKPAPLVELGMSLLMAKH